MGLLLWFPLNGNLNNYGTINATVTTSGSVAYADGKFKKALNDAGSTYISVNSITLGAEASIAHWSKTSTNAKMPWTLTTNNWGSNVFCLYENEMYTLNIGDGNDNPFVDDEGNPINVLHDNLWHHFVVTFGSGMSKLYIDGVYRGKAITFRNPTSTNKVFRIAGGYNNAHSYDWNGLLNDVRVYDYCLSPHEVKEISQALILHYPLNTTYTFSSEFDNTIYTEPDGSKWMRVAHHNNPGAGVFSTSDDFAHGVYIDENRWYDIERMALKVSTYEYMVKQKLTAGATEVKYRWTQTKSPQTSVYNDVKPASVTRITTAGYTDGTFGGIYISNPNGINSNARATIANNSNGNWFGAFGACKIYQNGIPGYPNTVVTTGYMDLYMRVSYSTPAGKIYDCSGHQNDGTIAKAYTVTEDNNVPRYKNCINFTDSNYIRITNQNVKVRDEITVCCWAYMDSWSGYNARLLSCTEGGGWNFEPNGGKMQFAMGTGASSNTYKSVQSTTPFTSYSSGWHFFTGTWDGYATKIYIDGNLEKTLSAYTTKTPIYYHASNPVFIAAEAQGNTNPAGSYFTGKMSDVRIYAKALSADDIKDLYKTSAWIAVSGTMSSYEFTEENSNNVDISHNGVVKCIEYIEEEVTGIGNVTLTGTGAVNYKPTPGTNRTSSGWRVILNDDLSISRTYNVELDVSWMGPWGATGGTLKSYFQGSNKAVGSTSYAWSGTNLVCTRLNSAQSLASLLTSAPTGTYHYKTTFTVPTNNGYNGFNVTTRTDYSDGVGTFTLKGLKVELVNPSTHTAKTTFDKEQIISVNFNEK